METGAVVTVTVQTMDGGDTASLPETLDEAERQLAEMEVEVEPKEVVADKGYHSNKTMTGVHDRGPPSYVSEPITEAPGRGGGSETRGSRPTPTAGGSGATDGSGCCASATRGWSGDSHTCW